MLLFFQREYYCELQQILDLQSIVNVCPFTYYLKTFIKEEL